MSQRLKIATRKSPLALWQANFVKEALTRRHQSLQVELVPVSTEGDKILDTPLAKIGGKGLFIKELEVAMLEGKADIAVHSMKDVPMEFPEGLQLAVITERGESRDAFVSNQYDSLDDLPEAAVVGTCSLRRQCQVKAIRPDIKIKDLRGNVGTRLAKLDAGEYDAIILAAAGLIRLEQQQRIKSVIKPEIILPAAGQGAIGIECRQDDEAILQLLLHLQHKETQIRITAERAMNARLQGGCQVPIAAFAEIIGERLSMRGLVGSIDGTCILQDSVTGSVNDARELGIALADKLLSAGADKILQEVKISTRSNPGG